MKTQLLKGLINLFSIIFRAKKIWHVPNEKKILIYDDILLKPLLDYININETEIYHVRNRQNRIVNMYVVFLMITQLKFSKENYKEIYLKLVNPKYIITFIDNSIPFYQLKKYCPKAITISIQGSHRMAVSDFFINKKKFIKKKLSSDFIFVFNNYVAKKYKEFIKSKCICIGSFISNRVKKKSNKKKYELLYISDFIFPFTVTKSQSDMQKKEYKTWDEFIGPVEQFLINLSKYLNKKKKRLIILGRGSDDKEAKLEKTYYEKIFKKENIIFLKNSEKRKKFDLLDKSKLVVTINSSLGYESFSRGTKTAFFSVRAKNGLFQSTKFGWPASKTTKGPCWTNDNSLKEIERVLNYLTKMTQNKWIKFRDREMSDLIRFDPGNKKFLKFAKNIGLPVNYKYL